MTEIKLLLNRCLLTEIKVCTSTQDTVYLFAYVVIYCAVQFLKQTRKTKVRNHRKETFPWISPVNKRKYLTNSRLSMKEDVISLYHIWSCIVLSSRCHNLASILLYCDSKCSCEIVYVLCVFSLSPTIQSVLVNFLKNFVDNKKSTALHYDLFLLHLELSKKNSPYSCERKLSNVFPYCNTYQQYTITESISGYLLFCVLHV